MAHRPFVKHVIAHQMANQRPEMDYYIPTNHKFFFCSCSWIQLVCVAAVSHELRHQAQHTYLQIRLQPHAACMLSRRLITVEPTSAPNTYIRFPTPSSKKTGLCLIGHPLVGELTSLWHHRGSDSVWMTPITQETITLLDNTSQNHHWVSIHIVFHVFPPL